MEQLSPDGQPTSRPWMLADHTLPCASERPASQKMLSPRQITPECCQPREVPIPLPEHDTDLLSDLAKDLKQLQQRQLKQNLEVMEHALARQRHWLASYGELPRSLSAASKGAAFSSHSSTEAVAGHGCGVIEAGNGHINGHINGAAGNSQIGGAVYSCNESPSSMRAKTMSPQPRATSRQVRALMVHGASGVGGGPSSLLAAQKKRKPSNISSNELSNSVGIHTDVIEAPSLPQVVLTSSEKSAFSVNEVSRMCLLEEESQTARTVPGSAESKEKAHGDIRYSVRAACAELYEKQMMSANTRSYLRYMPTFHEIVCEKIRRMEKLSFLHLDLIRNFVESKWFSVPVVTSIVINAIFLAVSSDVIVRLALEEDGGPENEVKQPRWVEVGNLTFLGIFAVELSMRMLAFEFSFFLGPDWRWNVLDFILLACGITEVTLQSVDLRLSFIRTFRLLRMLRSVRMVRVLRFFQELRLLLFSLLHSVVPLLWSLLFLALMLFMFAVIALQGVSDLATITPPEDLMGMDKLYRHFSNLPVTVLSHFAAVSGGINWWDMWSTLTLCDPVYGWVFSSYVVVMVLMVLNVITGIFVNNALEMAQTHREFAAQAVTNRRNSLFTELRRLFADLDTDGSGTISRFELQTYMRDASLQSAFVALDLDSTGVVALFDILDVDRSDTLEIEEFVMGCMRLTGAMKTMDLVLLVRDNKQLLVECVNRLSSTQAHLLTVVEKVQDVSNSVRNNTGNSTSLPLRQGNHHITHSGGLQALTPDFGHRDV